VIVAIGGVEVIVKVMQTFPKLQTSQESACGALRSLTTLCNIGKKHVIESGGIEVLLASVKNDLGSAILSQDACSTLLNIVRGSKENTELLISLGGGAAVANARTKWPDNDKVQTKVRSLANLIVADMKTWADEE
jgi:hypothetical protein